jgi:antitoxin HigA-1
MKTTTKKPAIYKAETPKIRPGHPGLVLAGILEDLNISQSELAKKIGISRRTISLIINGHQPITVDMALRLGKFCGNGPEIWLNMQQVVDLWDAMQENKKIYDHIKPANKVA